MHTHGAAKLHKRGGGEGADTASGPGVGDALKTVKGSSENVLTNASRFGEAYRQSGGTPPTIQQVLRPEAGVVGAGQRMQVTFQMANTSTIRQKVHITLQNDDPNDLRQVVCSIWVPPSPMQNYAMTAYTATGWPSARFIVAPQTSQSPTSHGWIQLDNVVVKKTNRAIAGTECFEPGSFVLDADGWLPNWSLEPTPPPAPAPMPVPDLDHYSIVETVPGLDEITFHSEGDADARDRHAGPEPAQVTTGLVFDQRRLGPTPHEAIAFDGVLLVVTGAEWYLCGVVIAWVWRHSTRDPGTRAALSGRE